MISTTPTKLLRDLDLANLIGCSRRHIWTLVSLGRLPQPIRLSRRCVRWNPEEVARAIRELS